MIIDCQTNLTGRLSAIELAEFSEAVGKADAFFLLAAPNLAVTPEANDVMLEFLEKSPKAMGFAVFDPIAHKDPCVEAQSLVSKRGVKGLALYCPHNGMHPMDSRAIVFYEWAQRTRVPLFFYNSNKLPATAALEYAQPYLIDEVARTFPDLKIIIGNAGRPFIHQTIAVLSKNTNVYATLAINPTKMWSVYNVLVSAAEADALDKFLFCSNYPESSMYECMESLLGFNRSISDTKLPLVPLDKVRNMINRNSIDLLHIS
ncbi:MAG: amidohydrolase family protein [Sedimentisphaeraceae bacterium JB056]